MTLPSKAPALISDWGNNEEHRPLVGDTQEDCDNQRETCDLCDFDLNTMGMCVNMHCSSNEDEPHER